MANTKKIAPHLAALARVNELQEQERASVARRDEARTRLADVQNRNQSGDQSVTGLDLISARADVEAAEGLAANATRVLIEARAEAASLQAEKTAQEVRDALGDFDPDSTLHEAEQALIAACDAVEKAVASRDAASDAVGQKLADAGVPAGRWVNGIRYEPVRTNSNRSRVASTNTTTYMGTVIPGRYNVEVQTEEGGTAWLGSAGLTRDSNRLVASILDRAWAGVRP